MNEIDNATMESIVAAALAAPSAENVHHFEFRWHAPDGLDIVGPLVPEGECAANTRRLALIGLGAMCRNIEIQAAALGLAVEFAGKEDGGVLSGLSVRIARSGVPAPSALAAVLFERHTNRKLYRGPGPSPAQKESLARCADAGVGLYWADRQSMPRLRSMIWRAESERFKSRALHHEMFSAIRFDLPWNARAPRGLPLGALEIEPFLRPGFRLLAHWGLARVGALLGTHRLIGLRAGWLPARAASELGVVFGDAGSEADLQQAGACFESIWLELTSMGFSVQPLAASALFALPGWVGVSRSCHERLKEDWERVLGAGRQPLMVFRVGTAGPATVRTGRQSPGEVLRPNG